MPRATSASLEGFIFTALGELVLHRIKIIFSHKSMEIEQKKVGWAKWEYSKKRNSPILSSFQSPVLSNLLYFISFIKQTKQSTCMNKNNLTCKNYFTQTIK